MQRSLRSESSSRRDVLKQAGLLAAGLVAGSNASSALAQATPATPVERKRALRLAHVTDLHVKPEAHAAENITKCLHHLQEHQRPDLIIGTGDLIWDSMATEESQVRVLWELSEKIWKSECSTPVEHAVGNHDCWGLRKAKSKTTGSEPLYGKKWVMSIRGWERTYRSFDRGGWHFIALDDIHPTGDGYVGHIDDEQFEWLKQDLAQVNPSTPVLLFCHIPLLSAAAYFKSQAEKGGNWEVPASVMNIDARRTKDLFYKHPNVKCCLSGHLHLYDRVDYLGVSYICGGAVAGGWWRGRNQECDPGYNVVDLYTDGSVENKYVNYGWQPEA